MVLFLFLSTKRGNATMAKNKKNKGRHKNKQNQQNQQNKQNLQLGQYAIQGGVSGTIRGIIEWVIDHFT